MVLPLTAKATFNIHTAGTNLVEWVEDESIRPVMAAALKGLRLEITSKNSTSLYVEATSTPLPMPVSFKLTVRQGEQTIPAGIFAASATRTNSLPSFVRGRLQPGLAVVIFKPDDAPAAGTIDVHRAWKGEILIRNVPVTDLPTKTGT